MAETTEERRARVWRERQERRAETRLLGEPEEGEGSEGTGRSVTASEIEIAGEVSSPALPGVTPLEMSNQAEETIRTLADESMRIDDNLSREDALKLARRKLQFAHVGNEEFSGNLHGIPERTKPSLSDFKNRYGERREGLRLTTNPDSAVFGIYDAIDAGAEDSEIESMIDDIDASLIPSTLKNNVSTLTMASGIFNYRTIDIAEATPTPQARFENRRQLARDIDTAMRAEGILPAFAMAMGRQTMMTGEEAQNLGFDIDAIQNGADWIDRTVGVGAGIIGASLVTGRPQAWAATKVTGTPYFIPSVKANPFTRSPFSYTASKAVEAVAPSGKVKGPAQTRLGQWLYPEVKATVLLPEGHKYQGKLPPRVGPADYFLAPDPGGKKYPGFKGLRKFSGGGALKITGSALLFGFIGYGLSRTSRNTPDFWRGIPMGRDGLLAQIKAPQGLVDLSTRFQILTGIADQYIPFFADNKEDARRLQLEINRSRPAETWNRVIESVRVYLDNGMSVEQASKDEDVKNAVRHLILGLTISEMPEHVIRGRLDLAKFKLLGQQKYDELTQSDVPPAIRTILIAVENNELTDHEIRRHLRAVPIGLIAKYFPELLDNLIPSEQSFMDSILLAAGADIDAIFTGGGRTTVPAARAFGTIFMETAIENGEIVIQESSIGRIMRVVGGFQEVFMEAPLPFTPAGIDFARSPNKRVRDPNTSYLARVLANIYTGEMGLSRHMTDLMYAKGVDRNSGEFLFWGNVGILADWLVPWEAPPLWATGQVYRTAHRGWNTWSYWSHPTGRKGFWEDDASGVALDAKKKPTVAFRLDATLSSMFPRLRSKRFSVDLEVTRAVNHIRDIVGDADLDNVEALERLSRSDDDRLGVHERRVLDAVVSRMKETGEGFGDSINSIPEIKHNDIYALASRGIELMAHGSLNSIEAEKFLETVPSHVLNEVLTIYEIVTGTPRQTILKNLKNTAAKRKDVALKTIEHLLTYGDPNIINTRQSDAYKRVETDLYNAADKGFIDRAEIPTILTSLEKQAWRYAMEDRIYDPIEFFEYVSIKFERDGFEPKKADPDVDVDPEAGETPTAPPPTHSGRPTTIETDFGPRKFEPDLGNVGVWIDFDLGLGKPIEFSPKANSKGYTERPLRRSVIRKNGEVDPVLKEVMRGEADGPWRLKEGEAPVPESMDLFVVIDGPDGKPVIAVFMEQTDKGGPNHRLTFKIRTLEGTDAKPLFEGKGFSVADVTLDSILAQIELMVDSFPDIDAAIVFSDVELSAQFQNKFKDVLKKPKAPYSVVESAEVEDVSGVAVKRLRVVKADDADSLMDAGPTKKYEKQRREFEEKLTIWHEEGFIDEPNYLLTMAFVDILPDQLFRKVFLSDSGSLDLDAGVSDLGFYNVRTGEIKMNFAKPLNEGPIEEFADIDFKQFGELFAEEVDKVFDQVSVLTQAMMDAKSHKSRLEIGRRIKEILKEKLGRHISHSAQQVMERVFGPGAAGQEEKIILALASQMTLSVGKISKKWNAPGKDSIGIKTSEVINETIASLTKNEMLALSDSETRASTFIHELVHALHASFLPETDIRALRTAYLREASKGFPDWSRSLDFKGRYGTEATFSEWLADTLSDYLITKELPKSLMAQKEFAENKTYWKRTFDAFVKKFKALMKYIRNDKVSEEFPPEILDISERLIEGKINIGSDVSFAEREALFRRQAALDFIVAEMSSAVSGPIKNTPESISKNNQRIFEVLQNKIREGRFDFSENESSQKVINEVLSEVGEFMAFGHDFETAVSFVAVMGRPSGADASVLGLGNVDRLNVSWRNADLRLELFGPLRTNERIAPDWIQSVDDLPLIEKLNLADAVIKQYKLNERLWSTQDFRKYIISGGKTGSVPRDIEPYLFSTYRSDVDKVPRKTSRYEVRYSNPDDVLDELLMTNEDVFHLTELFQTGDFRKLFSANGRLIARLMGETWYKAFAKNFDHSGKTSPVLTPSGAAHAADVFENYVNTLETPDGISPRAMDDLYRSMQDFWIKHRQRGLSTISPKSRAFWDRFLRPEEALRRDVSDMTSKLGRTFPGDKIRLETEKALEEESAIAQAQKRTFYQVDRRLENVLQAIGYRPGEAEVDPVDLFARILGYVSGEHARKTFGHPMDMVPMTTKSIVPRNRVKEIQKAVDEMFGEIFGHNDATKNYDPSTNTFTFNDFEAEGLRIHIRSLAREPLGAATLEAIPAGTGRHITDWDRDLTTVTADEWNAIQTATVDVLAGPAARQTSYTHKIPKSLGYAWWNALKQGGSAALEKFGPDSGDNVMTRFRSVLSSLKKEQFAGGDLNPEAVEALNEIIAQIGNVDKDFRALIVRAMRSNVEIDEGELFAFFEHMFQAPVDPAKVTRLLGSRKNKDKGIEFVQPFRERFDSFVQELRNADIDSDSYIPQNPKDAVDPIDGMDVDIEQGSMLIEILDSLEELQDIITTRDLTGKGGPQKRRLREQEREALRILGLYRRKAYKAFEEGKTPDFSEADRRAMGDALYRLRKSVKEKEEAVIQRGRIILGAFVGGMGVELTKRVPDVDLGAVYSLFYTGKLDELMAYVSNNFKTKVGTRPDQMPNFNPGLAMMEVMVRLRCMDLVEGLNKTLLRSGIGLSTWDIARSGRGKILEQGPEGAEHVGINEDLYYQRVLFYLNQEQHYLLARRVYFKKVESGEVEYQYQEFPDAPRQDTTTEGIFPSDEITKAADNFFPRDTLDNVHDMMAYEAAMDILDRLGIEPSKRGFERYVTPDGQEMFMPSAVVMEIENAYDRVSRVGSAYGPRAATPNTDRLTQSVSERIQERDLNVRVGMAVNEAAQTLAALFPMTFRNVRMGVTTGIGIPNPAYYMGVGMGGFFQMYQGMGITGTIRALFRNASQTKAVVVALYKDGLTKNGRRMSIDYSPDAPPLVTRHGMVYSTEQLIRLTENAGLKSSFIHAETIQALTKDLERMFSGKPVWAKTVGRGGREWQRTLIETATAMDNFYRVSIFLDYLERGFTPAHAAERARKFLYDYADLSEAEKSVGRNLIMFYSYMRKNLDHFWETLLTNPARLIGQIRLVRGVQQVYLSDDPEIMMKEYQINRLPVFIRNTQINTQRNAQIAYITPPLPMMDALNLYVDIVDAAGPLRGKTTREDALRGLASRFMPHIQALPVLATGQDIFYNRSLDDYNKVPPWLVELDRAITGGMIVDGAFNITPRSHLDATKADQIGLPEQGWFHAKNGKAWWIWRNLMQTPGGGRSMDTFNWLDRANTGILEAFVAATRSASRKLDRPILKPFGPTWSEMRADPTAYVDSYGDPMSARHTLDRPMRQLHPRMNMMELTLTSDMSEDEVRSKAASVGVKDVWMKNTEGEYKIHLNDVITLLMEKQATAFSLSELAGMFGMKPVYLPTRSTVRARSQTRAKNRMLMQERQAALSIDPNVEQTYSAEKKEALEEAQLQAEEERVRRGSRFRQGLNYEEW